MVYLFVLSAATLDISHMPVFFLCSGSVSFSTIAPCANATIAMSESSIPCILSSLVPFCSSCFFALFAVHSHTHAFSAISLCVASGSLIISFATFARFFFASALLDIFGLGYNIYHKDNYLILLIK